MAISRFPRSSTTIGAFAAAWLSCLLLAAPAGAASLRFESATVAAGSALVRDAASGRVDEAIQRAAELGRPGDNAFASNLQGLLQTLATQHFVLGDVHSVSTIDESYFAGCVRHEYRVRYAGGDQQWTLKWRRSADGWHLSDLVVRGPTG